MARVKILTWVAWVHKILASVKKGVNGVGSNFGVVGVGLRCFIEQVLLKVSKNVKESTCAGISC